jgi:hypothetical protein
LVSRTVAIGALAAVIAAAVGLPAGAEAQSAEVRFHATVDRERVEVGQTLVLTVTASVPDEARVRSLVLPSPDAFDVISTSRATQTTFSFGSGGQRGDRVTTHTLVLRATATGAQTIPPAIMEYAGRTLRTDPITIAVLPVGDLGRQRDPRGQADPGRGGGRRGRSPSVFDDDFDPMAIFDQLQRQMDTDLFGGGGRGSGGLSPPQEADDDLFVRVEVDKREVWLGEQLTATIVIYSRYDIGGFPSPPSMPQMAGFWQEDLERPSHIRPRIETIGGIPYRAYVLRRVALFPTRAGEIEIDPVEVEVETALGLFRGRRSVTRRSRPVAIRVRALPSENQPDAFAGTNVGRWDLSASLDQPRTTTGEPVTLSVTVSGEGNVHAVEPPPLPDIDGLRVYEPSRSHDTRATRNRFGGTKTVSWILVPTRTGSFTVPEMKLHYFDPASGRYETRKAGPLVLHVTAGTGPVASGFTPRGATGGNVLEADALRTIRYGVVPSHVGPPAYRSPAFLGLMGLGAAVLFGLFLADGVRRRVEAASESGRGRKAPSVAKGRLKAARKRAAAGDRRGAASEISTAIGDYLNASAGIQVRGLSRELLRHALDDRECPADLAEVVCDLLEGCETARYSPFDPEASEIDGLLVDAEGVLRRLVGLKLRGEGGA